MPLEQRNKLPVGKYQPLERSQQLTRGEWKRYPQPKTVCSQRGEEGKPSGERRRMEGVVERRTAPSLLRIPLGGMRGVFSYGQLQPM